MNDAIQIYPINDLIVHIESTDCFCRPTIQFLDNDRQVVIHNSLDGREYEEENSKKYGKWRVN